MPKQLKYQLSETELKQIEQAIKSAPEPRVRQRATGIRLLHLGKKPEEAAELLNVAIGTIYNWHERWRENGLAGLSDAPRSGRPTLADENYTVKLAEVLETDPTTLGYGFTIWTIDRLRAHMAKITNIRMSDETFRAVLRQNDYVYRRPKHDLKPLQDQEARDRAEEIIADLKKKPKTTRSSYSLWTKLP
jgi:transposase